MKKEIFEKVRNRGILKIEEYFDPHLEGYSIYLENDSRIDFGISNLQACYEDWGTIDSPDNLKDYTGAKILNISCVDAVSFNITDDYENVAFISVETTKGLFQMAVYNEHNGYYGHDVKIVINGETIEEEII